MAYDRKTEVSILVVFATVLVAGASLLSAVSEDLSSVGFEGTEQLLARCETGVRADSAPQTDRWPELPENPKRKVALSLHEPARGLVLDEPQHPQKPCSPTTALVPR